MRLASKFEPLAAEGTVVDLVDRLKKAERPAPPPAMPVDVLLLRAACDSLRT